MNAIGNDADDPERSTVVRGERLFAQDLVQWWVRGTIPIGYERAIDRRVNYTGYMFIDSYNPVDDDFTVLFHVDANYGGPLTTLSMFAFLN